MHGENSFVKRTPTRGTPCIVGLAPIGVNVSSNGDQGARCLSHSPNAARGMRKAAGALAHPQTSLKLTLTLMGLAPCGRPSHIHHLLVGVLYPYPLCVSTLSCKHA